MMPGEEATGDRFNRREILLVLLCASGVLVVLLRNAWVSDDAYITFRTIDNLVNGFGLRWNVAERVQTFTNPLWLMVMTVPYFVTRDFYSTTIAISVTLTMACFVAITLRLASTSAGIILAACLLVFSKAFMDYSTSGLENPLTHIMLVLFFVVFASERRLGLDTILALALLAGWCTLNRMDTLLLFLPALVYALVVSRKPKALVAAICGFIPFLLWEAFAIFYYGFPFPNTAYAKLGTGIASAEMWRQGYLYIIDSLNLDPITMMTVLLGISVPIIRRDIKDAMMALGAFLYLVYVVEIGGDFMSGRFLVAPMLVAVMLLVRLPWPATRPTWMAIILVGALGYASPYSPVHTGSDYDHRKGYEGIMDERGFYYHSTGLLTETRQFGIPRGHWFVQQAEHQKAEFAKRTGKPGIPVATTTSGGLFGLFCGPKVHVLDLTGITDPLLARLPAMYDPSWRIGHFKRLEPAGYIETLETGKNSIVNDSLAKYYDVLTIITRGPLWSTDRLVAIVGMNLGFYDDLIDWDGYRYPHRLHAKLSQISAPKQPNTVWNARGNKVMGNSGIDIDLEKVVHDRQLEVNLDHNDEYQITYMLAEQTLATVVVESLRTKKEGLSIRLVHVPQEVARKGYNRIIVMPHAGDGRYSLGHLRFPDSAQP